MCTADTLWDGGLSNSLEASESLKVLQQAVEIHGKPAIMNSDQGSQFTCFEYINFLKENDIKISMDGKGRALDNIFIERFWRTIKYQYIYLNPKDNTPKQLKIQLRNTNFWSNETRVT